MESSSLILLSCSRDKRSGVKPFHPDSRAFATTLTAPIEMIQHPVNQHARHRDVKPKGQSPAGNSLVLLEALPPGAVKRDEDQRHDQRRKDCVGTEQHKVETSNGTLSEEAGCPVKVVIGEVADQENH